MDSTTEEMTPEEYGEAFAGKEPEALEQALDTRKFEIDLYWRRLPISERLSEQV
mgnify:FL=1|jgi:hypothetical protein|tara:strand:- start:10798 stop:10959 length:162 start_codon:yes stop_codon:yes gene_type:complete